MKKHTVVLHIFLLLLLCTGCQSVEEVTPPAGDMPITASETQIGSTTNTIETASSFDFTLPIGYMIDNSDGSTCDIISGDVVVGGFTVTGLDVSCIDARDCDEIIGYLETYVASHEQYEYFMDHWTSHLNIVLKITNPEIDETYEQYHHLFEEKGICYDMWLDGRLVDRESAEEFVDTVGIGG